MGVVPLIPGPQPKIERVRFSKPPQLKPGKPFLLVSLVVFRRCERRGPQCSGWQQSCKWGLRSIAPADCRFVGFAKEQPISLDQPNPTQS